MVDGTFGEPTGCCPEVARACIVNAYSRGDCLRTCRRSTAAARVAVVAGQRKEVIRSPIISMFFRRDSPGSGGSAVAVDLPGVDKGQQRGFFEMKDFGDEN
jgi:hypothetical protein